MPSLNGIRIPGWLIGAAIFVAGVFGAGLAYGAGQQENKSWREIVDLRFCRLERAFGLEPWPTCPNLRGNGTQSLPHAERYNAH